MDTWRTAHMYLSCLFAPLLIFFIITGSWQMFELHEREKGGYAPPRIVEELSELHTRHGRLGDRETPMGLRLFVLAMAVGIIATTALGVLMALNSMRHRVRLLACLLAGVGLPAGIVLLEQALR